MNPITQLTANTAAFIGGRTIAQKHAEKQARIAEADQNISHWNRIFNYIRLTPEEHEYNADLLGEDPDAFRPSVGAAMYTHAHGRGRFFHIMLRLALLVAVGMSILCGFLVLDNFTKAPVEENFDPDSIVSIGVNLIKALGKIALMVLGPIVLLLAGLPFLRRLFSAKRWGKDAQIRFGYRKAPWRGPVRIVSDMIHRTPAPAIARLTHQAAKGRFPQAQVFSLPIRRAGSNPLATNRPIVTGETTSQKVLDRFNALTGVGAGIAYANISEDYERGINVLNLVVVNPDYTGRGVSNLVRAAESAFPNITIATNESVLMDGQPVS